MTTPSEEMDLEPVLVQLYQLLAQRYQPNENGTDTLRHFYLVRDEDKTGTSGTGKVAEAFVFEHGEAVLVWLVDPYGIDIYRNVEMLKKVHGHEGATRLVPADDETSFTMPQRIAQSRRK
jgi:hypothetical protein